ncbi:MAG: NAD-dependent epimerase/dehydratase family protein [Gemmataceae bacterium]
MNRRIFLTGAAGRLGRAITPHLLAAGHAVQGFDIAPSHLLPVESQTLGSITDAAAVLRAMTGCDTLIHLAAVPDDAHYPRGAAPEQDGDNFLNELLPVNIQGTYCVLEAARRLKLRQVLLASTGQVVERQLDQGPLPITVDAVTTPRYLYASTKVFLEALGSAYAWEHQLSTIAVRLGWCPRDAGQVAAIAACEVSQDVYLSPEDAGRFFVACMAAEELPMYLVLFATSRARHQVRYDLQASQRWLGWSPQEEWPQGID